MQVGYAGCGDRDGPVPCCPPELRLGHAHTCEGAHDIDVCGRLPFRAELLSARSGAVMLHRGVLAGCASMGMRVTPTPCRAARSAARG